MWEAVERQPGVYDDAYLDKVETLINRLGEAGIYTLVDQHQDMFARNICGEGFPDFYAKQVIGKNPSCFSPLIDSLLKPVLDKLGFCKDMSSYGYQLDENDNPLISECTKLNYVYYYGTTDSINAYDALYNNKDGLRDKFVAFWDKSSARFSNSPYVVGFDPINEPQIGNWFKDLKLLIPGNMDRHELQPLYEEIFEKYYANSKDTVMWFEPQTFLNVLGLPFFENGTFPNIIFESGFTNPPGAEFGSVNHVFNDHTYCCQLSPEACVAGEPDVNLKNECKTWHRKRIGTRSADAQRYGIPLMITEFGACVTEGPCT